MHRDRRRVRRRAELWHPGALLAGRVHELGRRVPAAAARSSRRRTGTTRAATPRRSTAGASTWFRISTARARRPRSSAARSSRTSATARPAPPPGCSRSRARTSSSSSRSRPTRPSARRPGFDEQHRGNALVVKATLRRVDGKPLDLFMKQVTFRLSQRSHEPGVSMNFPSEEERASPPLPDLSFEEDLNAPLDLEYPRRPRPGGGHRRGELRDGLRVRVLLRLGRVRRGHRGRGAPRRRAGGGPPRGEPGRARAADPEAPEHRRSDRRRPGAPRARAATATRSSTTTGSRRATATRAMGSRSTRSTAASARTARTSGATRSARSSSSATT